MRRVDQIPSHIPSFSCFFLPMFTLPSPLCGFYIIFPTKASSIHCPNDMLAGHSPLILALAIIIRFSLASSHLSSRSSLSAMCLPPQALSHIMLLRGYLGSFETPCPVVVTSSRTLIGTSRLAPRHSFTLKVFCVHPRLLRRLKGIAKHVRVARSMVLMV